MEMASKGQHSPLDPPPMPPPPTIFRGIKEKSDCSERGQIIINGVCVDGFNLIVFGEREGVQGYWGVAEAEKA